MRWQCREEGVDCRIESRGRFEKRVAPNEAELFWTRLEIGAPVQIELACLSFGFLSEGMQAIYRFRPGSLEGLLFSTCAFGPDELSLHRLCPPSE
jgi:hypothetical protein